MTHHRTVIVGTGFSGIGMAIKLLREGERDFVLLERADEIGGTWRDNTYPGCRCDVPSHLYSFSFAPNPNWSSTFSPQPEILDYLRDVAARFGVLPHVRFGTELEAASGTRGAALAARDLAGADHRRRADRRPGPLSDPLVPDLPGLDSFEGTTSTPPRWDHDHDLDGERVAVIGTGASAIQFVPEIQPLVGQLHVFQRTPPWVMPHPNRPMKRLGAQALRPPPAGPAARCAPASTGRARPSCSSSATARMRKLATRMALRQLKQQVPDPELRAKLTPRYELGCKRILPTDEWYPALTQPNVEVVTDGIREIRPHSIVAEDGTEREVDTIIFGTGFHVTDIPIAQRVRGRDGRTLAETWDGSAAPTRAPPWPATPTCSSWSGRTPASATTRSCS